MKRQALAADAEAAITLKQILVAIDFSALSQQTLRFAARLAEQNQAALILVHVIEPELPPSYEGWMISPLDLNGNQSRDGELRALRELVRACENGSKLPTETLIRRGLPTHEIVETAHEHDVDLIVLGTHGHTGWKHFAIGSTAERVVRAAPCPVLVVRPKEHAFT